jgi:hypothetical protein
MIIGKGKPGHQNPAITYLSSVGMSSISKCIYLIQSSHVNEKDMQR